MNLAALIPGAQLLAALALDRAIGEPPNRWHPLVAFGALASWVERLLYPKGARPMTLIVRGGIGVVLLIGPLASIIVWLDGITLAGEIASVAILYLCIAQRSLEEHAQAVAKALREDDLPLARAAVARIVSRDTEAMSAVDIARATVESILENGNDAVFGALFWFFVLGAPGVVVYRLANTLDAMWGYRSDRYLYFGRVAARLDDVLNYFPARLTAATYACLGNRRSALSCWRVQAPLWYSPNAGPVMAAGAGALLVQLGGMASYGGQPKERPILGAGDAPGIDAIDRAVRLVRHSLLLWTAGYLALCIAWALAS